MKKIRMIILILFLMPLFLGVKEVNATSFRSGENIPGIYRSKEKDGEVLSSRAERFMRNSQTNEATYCVEPYGILINNLEYSNEYREYSADLNITPQEYKRIILLAYYGYNYGNHTDPKWYSITQILIWRTIDKTSDFYWTDWSINGTRIEPYNVEIAEIEQLIENHNKLPYMPSILDTKASINNEYSFEDINNVIQNYTITNSNTNAEIVGNRLIVSSTSVGEKYVELEQKEGQHNKPARIYTSVDSQDVMEVGNYVKEKVIISFEVLSGSISITKIDKDTKSTTPSGNATLINSIYELYDENDQLVDELIIDSNSKAQIENLPFGKYSLKEIQSGKGYYIDSKVYTFEIDGNNTNIEMEVESEVISSKILLHKYYGNEKKWHDEACINFQIYNELGILYKEVKTDENGIVEVVLPYGKYKFVQLNTTDDYQVVNSFEITIDELSSKTIKCDLYDVEIESPNTSIDKVQKEIVYYFKRKKYE